MDTMYKCGWREPGKNDELTPRFSLSPKSRAPVEARLGRGSTVLARRSTDVVVCHLFLWKACLRAV
jgi:hypothetical protein